LEDRMVLGRAVGIGKDLTRAEHRAEDPATDWHATHVGRERVAEKGGRLSLWQLTGRHGLWLAVDRERGDTRGSQIPGPVHIAEGRDHPAAAADRDDRDRGGSIHTATATADGEERVGTERHAPSEHAAGDGIEERNEEGDAGFFVRMIDLLSWHHRGASVIQSGD